MCERFAIDEFDGFAISALNLLSQCGLIMSWTFAQTDFPVQNLMQTCFLPWMTEIKSMVQREH